MNILKWAVTAKLTVVICTVWLFLIASFMGAAAHASDMTLPRVQGGEYTHVLRGTGQVPGDTNVMDLLTVESTSMDVCIYNMGVIIGNMYEQGHITKVLRLFHVDNGVPTILFRTEKTMESGNVVTVDILLQCLSIEVRL